MSANQLIRPGGGLTHGMDRDRTRHDCPDCWRNGGPGHHLVPIRESVANWLSPAKASR